MDNHPGSGSNFVVKPSDTSSSTSPLLTSLSAKFPEAVLIISQSRKAMQFVGEADAAGVQFGGYAEEGPEGSQDSAAYTIGKIVYVPQWEAGHVKTKTIPAVCGFLFELSNAINQLQFAALEQAAKNGNINEEKYAYGNIALEVDGALRLGEIWLEVKGSHSEWDHYDDDFYLSTYLMFQTKEVTKEQIVESVLETPYPKGKWIGQTHQQFYVDQYRQLRAQHQ
jgi:hypothetical protein